jgi:hypothetical protein
MGLPKILIEFTTLAETLITRSERGVVAVILKDNSNASSTNTYCSEAEITKSHYTAANLNLLSLAFLGTPQKLIVERVGTDETIDSALERLKNRQNFSQCLFITPRSDSRVSSMITGERNETGLYDN